MFSYDYLIDIDDFTLNFVKCLLRGLMLEKENGLPLYNPF